MNESQNKDYSNSAKRFSSPGVTLFEDVHLQTLLAWQLFVNWTLS